MVSLVLTTRNISRLGAGVSGAADFTLRIVPRVICLGEMMEKRRVRLIVSLVVVGMCVLLVRQNATSEDFCSGCHFTDGNTNNSHYIDGNEDCGFCHQVDTANDGHEVTTITENYTCQSCHHNQDSHGSADAHSTLQCVDCHDPHGSDGGDRLRSDVITLCSETCHAADQLGRSHPIGVGVADIAAGTEMTCISTCHSVHSSQGEKLLQLAGIDLCAQCHVDKF